MDYNKHHYRGYTIYDYKVGDQHRYYAKTQKGNKYETTDFRRLLEWIDDQLSASITVNSEDDYAWHR